MRRPARATARTRGRLRGALAVAALAGYLVALGGTSAGQGWGLLHHLASAHAGRTAPTILPVTLPGTLLAIPTLRPFAASHSAPRHRPEPDDAHHAHPHGHAHTPGSDAPEATPPHRAVRTAHAHNSPPRPGGETPDTGRFHRHGPLVHTHGAPAPEPPLVVVRRALDTHRLPEVPRLPAPPSREAPEAGPAARPSSVDGSVETPPPIARG